MVGIKEYFTYIPDNLLDVLSLGDLTLLSLPELKVFKKIYGLHRLPIYSTNSVPIYEYPLHFFTLNRFIQKKMSIIIYVHTGEIVLPYGDSFSRQFKKLLPDSKHIFLNMTAYKCVSYFKALMIISHFLNNNVGSYGLIVTGEVAISPYLRVVPNTTLVGDAATVSLFLNNATSHKLLHADICYVGGFSEGIYLSQQKLASFDRVFIAQFASFLRRIVKESGLLLSEISCILPHNVNVLTWMKVAEALNFSIDKVYLKNIRRYAHCFCSDQVINLSDAVIDGVINKGDYYLMAACGVGFYFGAAVFQY